MVLLFYDILGLFLFLTIFWNVGSGYNEFRSEKRTVIISRKGFPGKNKNLFLQIGFNEIRALKLRIKTFKHLNI